MQNRKSILTISVSAIFLALIIVFSYIPNLGYITLGPISFTTIHIIVLIGAMIFGKWLGLVYGTFFGFFSLIISFQYPGTVNYLFINPFVSILPRILFGFISGCVFDFFRKHTDKANFLIISAPIAGILTIMHTFFTLICLYVFGYLDIFRISQALGMSDIIEANEALFGSFGNFILVFIAPGSVCECAAAIILTPSISSLYAYHKLPTNFYKLGVVKEIGYGKTIFSRKLDITLVTIFSIVAIGLCALVLCLYYLV